MVNNVEKCCFQSYNEIKYMIGGTKMDRITQNLVETFKEEHCIDYSDMSLVFEYFTNYSVVNSVYIVYIYTGRYCDN